MRPTLWVRATQNSEATEVYAADAAWNLLLPPGYELRGNSGSMDTVIEVRRPAIVKLLTWLHQWGDSAPGVVQLVDDIELSDWQPAHSKVTSSPKYDFSESKSEFSAPMAKDALPEPAMELARRECWSEATRHSATDLPAIKPAEKAESLPPASQPQSSNMAELSKAGDEKPSQRLEKETKTAIAIDKLKPSTKNNYVWKEWRDY